jgi:hypothetical protein
VTAERCERCDRPVATEADWAAICEHECESPACTWGDDRCWGDRAECEMVGVPIDWRTRARDEARRADAAEANAALRSAMLLMVGSEICADPKIDARDHGDPRWTPTLLAACELRRRADAAEAERDALRALLSDLAHEMHCAADDRLRDKGGQHVPYHGTFAGGVGMGAAHRLRRRANEILLAIGTKEAT